MIAIEGHADGCFCQDCMDVTPYTVIAQNVKGGFQRGDSIGASDAPRLLGLDTFISAEDAFGAFVRRESTPPNPYTVAGQHLEGAIIAWANKHHMRRFAPWQDRLRSRSHPWLTATPDARDADDEQGGGEVKYTGIGQWKEHWQNGPPDKVLCQAQLQMFVTGWSRNSVIHWCHGQWPAIWPVKRDERLIYLFLGKLEKIWQRVLIARKETL